MTGGREEIIRREGWLLGWLATVFGATIIGSHIESGQSRWSAAAWSFALEVPGSPATWGAVILASGTLMLTGLHRNQPHLQLAGALLSFVWFCALAAAAMLAFVVDLFNTSTANTVNPLSVVTWTTFALMYQLHAQDENPKLFARVTARLKRWARRA